MVTAGLVLGGIALAAGTIAGVSIFVNGVSSSILGLLRQIAIWLDSTVYSLASWAYGIFYELSSSSLLSSLNLAAASQRLYTLLGIFMLFRLAFSFIKYIVNPDDMEKGTSKFITNLAVSLALIVSVPWIFNRAFKLQTYIMESNVIGNLILGMNLDKSDEDTFNASSYGQSIAFMVFSAFYRPNLAISGLESCNNLLVYYNDYVEPSSNNQVKYNDNAKNDAVAKESQKIEACVNALNNLSESQKTAFVWGAEDNETEIGTMFYIASQRMDMSLLTHPGVFRAYVSDSYVINYTAIVSTIALGFLALLFINFSFDVAIRNVKLCFLQIIAPIPIILNIEPGDAKGDKRSLNWWVKECLRTYVDLFVRVATVYFGVFLINILFTGNSVLGSSNTSPWFRVFMILGILLFVKQIPDMIGKAFGIDVKGQFSLNPLKRIGESRLASMAVGGAAGLAGGLGTGIAAGIAAHRAGAGVGESIRRGLTGGLGGAAHSAFSGARRGAGRMGDIIGNARENLSRSGRIASANVGTTWGDRMDARLSGVIGSKTRFQREEDIAAALEVPGKSVSTIHSIMNSDKTTVSKSVTMGAGTRTFSSAADANDFLNSNPQLTNADRQAVLKASKAFEQTDVLRSSALVANGHRYKNYEEAMADYANNKSLSMEEKHNLLGALNSRKTAISAAAAAQTVTLAGQVITNTKDANDYLERLRSSGAPEAALRDAENQVSAIRAQRYEDAINAADSYGGTPNVYSLERDKMVRSRSENSEYYDRYVVDSTGAPITDFNNFSNVKAASGAGNLGAGAVRGAATRYKAAEDAVRASGGPGRGH